jgi:hypothetical protein
MFLVSDVGIPTNHAVHLLPVMHPLIRNHYRRGKAISVKYSECVFVVLVIQHAKFTRLIILSSVACLALPYFPHYLTNCTH